MFSGPIASPVFRARGVAAAVGASLLLGWLVVTAQPAPSLPPTAAEWTAPPVLVWFPLLTAPLLWPHWLRR